MSERKITCFVIMPYGEKQGINFDKVYNEAIEPAINDLDIICVRSDRISSAGSIHRDMFTHIVDDEVAVVDVSTLNPNVMYELGVRHTTRRNVTVMIGQKGTPMPFNIAGHRMIEYESHNEASYVDLSNQIKRFVRNGLTRRNETDSPVHDDLKDLRVTRGYSPEIEDCVVYRYQLHASLKKWIGMVTGDIRRAKEVADIWVNPENVYMQMARPYDRAISAVIRYAGATKTIAGNIENDLIADELRDIMKRAGEKQVADGTVIPTGSGELAATHGVQLIFHVACARGIVGKGYQPVEHLRECVLNALALEDSPKFAEKNLRSILFPLLGTGTSRGDLNEKVPLLTDAAITHLHRPATQIECVLFLTFTEVELEICRSVIRDSPEVNEKSLVKQVVA